MTEFAKLMAEISWYYGHSQSSWDWEKNISVHIYIAHLDNKVKFIKQTLTGK
jgi:hypothetical protein